MLLDLKNNLSDRISKLLHYDLEKNPEKPIYDFYEKKMNKIIYFSGSFLRLGPEYILWTVCYNIFLAVTPLVVYILSVMTLVKRNLDMSSLILLGHYLCLLSITNVTHVYAAFHRSEGMMFAYFLMQRDKRQTPFYSKTNFAESSRRLFTKYWPLMVWGPWILFMVGMPAYSYFVKSKSYVLPFPLWFPFDTDCPIGFLAGYILEVLSVNCICVQIITGIPCYVYLCYIILSEYNMLNESLSTLHIDAVYIFQNMYEPTPKPSGYQLYEDPKFLFCLRKHFKEIIEHHQSIIRMIESLKNIADIPLTMILGMGSLTLACGTIFLVSDVGALSVKVTFAVLLAINLSVVGILCYLGEQIHSKGEKAREALYFTNWYDWPEDMKRTLRIMLARTLNPPTLSGAYITITPNYEAFTTLLNSAYSLLNLLLAFKQ